MHVYSGVHTKHSFPSVVACIRVYRAVAWQRVDEILYSIYGICAIYRIYAVYIHNIQGASMMRMVYIAILFACAEATGFKMSASMLEPSVAPETEDLFMFIVYVIKLAFINICTLR
jgi:hypothetical protein